MSYSDINFDSKTILITGGAGFIGSNLAFYFQNNYPNSTIVIFDCFRSEEVLPNGNLLSFGHYKNLIGFKGNIICGNINNKNDLMLLNDYKFDYIFHQAAISDTRLYNQELVMRTNVNAFNDILKIAKKNNSITIYASSAATYGSLPAPQTIGLESPENPYGYSKYMMDKMASYFAILNPSLLIIGMRFFNVYGPREFYKAKTASMVIQLAHQILDGKNPILFKNSNKIFRDFIYIDDVVQANIKACKSKNISNHEIYNVGTGKSRSFQDISNILQIELGTSIKNKYIHNPYNGYQSNTRADISKSCENIGFEPNFSLEEGIHSYINDIKRLHGSKSS